LSAIAIGRSHRSNLLPGLFIFPLDALTLERAKKLSTIAFDRGFEPMLPYGLIPEVAARLMPSGAGCVDLRNAAAHSG
jgi:hypothetical protein